MVNVVEVNPHDETMFDGWYSALRAGSVAGRSAVIVDSHSALGYSLRNPGPNLRRLPVVALAAGRVVGAMLFELPLRENLTTTMVEIDVPPPHRRRGVATALWEWAAERAAAEGRSIFHTDVNIPTTSSPQTWPGACFATVLGFDSKNVEDHLVVPLPFDDRRLAEIRRGVAQPDGYRVISWAGPCPERHLRAFADLHNAMEQDVPTGELVRAVRVWDVDRMRDNELRMDKSYLSLVSLVQTIDGQPAGYTWIFLPREDPDHVMQDDTLVLREHRGRNLGTHLKLANLEQLARHRVDHTWLHAWTEVGNGPMRKVNARFGFQVIEQLHELQKS